jgi:hypothetical protein
MTANGPERFPAGDDGDVGRSEDAGGSGFSATGSPRNGGPGGGQTGSGGEGGPGGGPADSGGQGGGGGPAGGGGQGGGSAGSGPPGGGPPGGGAGGEGDGGDDDPIEGEDLDDLDDDEDYDSEAPATFRPIPGGAACYFEPAQAGVIRSLVMQVAELISDSATSGLGAGDPAGGAGPAPGTGIAPGAGPEAGAGEGAGADAGAGGAADEDSPDELEMLLGLSANAELPDDPVLARLLPDAYSDDPQASAEFRRYTEESLRSSKINSAQAVLASLPAGGGDVVLSEPECQQWLRSLNDVRLALGVRLGITEEDEDLTENLSVNDPRSAYIWVYQWLAYLQDSLIESLG